MRFLVICRPVAGGDQAALITTEIIPLHPIDLWQAPRRGSGRHGIPPA
jgi:hypothetical protein